MQFGEDGEMIFLILFVMRNCGVVSTASETVQNKERKMEGTQYMEMVRDSWAEKEVKGEFREH